MDLITLLAAGLVAWALRASFIVAGGGRALPAGADRLLGQLRPAILGALVASAFMARAGGDVGAVPISWLLAAIATASVSRLRGSLAVAAGAGLGVVALAAALGLPA